MTSVPFVSQARVQAAVASIYSLAAEPGRIGEILDGFADVLGGKGLLMGPLARATSADCSLVTYASPVFHEALPAYLDHYVALNPRKNWLTATGAGDIVFSDHDFIDDTAIGRHAFYNDFLLPHENLYSLNRVSSRLGGRRLWISVQYGHRAPAPERWQREIFSILSDHLVQALDLYGRLRALRPEDGEVLEQFDCPALILSATGRILRLNGLADRFADPRIGFARGRVTASAPGDAVRLDRLLAGVRLRSTGGSAPDVIALTGDGTRMPLLVKASPYRTSEFEHRLGDLVDDLPQTLLLVHSDQPSGRSAVAALRTLGLTPAEARVADLVAAGRSPEEAADDLGIALSTARHHLKRAHEKLGIRRQADLVRIVGGLTRFAGTTDERG